MFRAVAEGHKENCALTFGVRGEETGYVIVVKCEAGRTQVLGICCEIELAAQDAGFELHGAIPAIAKSLQNGT